MISYKLDQVDSTSPDHIQYPQNPNNILCYQFIDSGKCCLGKNCPFDHPYGDRAEKLINDYKKRDEILHRNVSQTSSSYFNNTLPINDDAPTCKYYSLTGTCKYGSNCIFNHPPITIKYPRNPDNSNCEYYMKFGKCKFGTKCIYDHPPRNNIKNHEIIYCQSCDNNLPLRPGEPICKYYMENGICSFGSKCIFDHPIEFKSNR